ncbi:MAG: hypothetical protein V7785_16610 [Bermanella sp.]
MTELLPWWGGDVTGTYSLACYQEKIVDGSLIKKHITNLTLWLVRLKQHSRRWYYPVESRHDIKFETNFVGSNYESETY